MTNNTAFEVEEFAIIGRTFDEYVHMFDLDSKEIESRSILDCPSGVGSFVAEAKERGASVVGADVIYELPREDIAERCRRDCDRVTSQLPEKRELFTWEFYGNVETRARILERAYTGFLSNYSNETARGRYVPAALPELPFEDDSFSLVLSAHFLFLYGDRLDYEFHLASLRELLRVADDEVRVFPLVGLDTEPYDRLDGILSALEADGYSPEIATVPFEFQKGANEMLVVEA